MARIFRATYTRITCPTCGTVTRIQVGDTAAVCPECQDWLPVEKIPDVLPVAPPKKHKSARSFLADPLCVAGIVVAGVVVGIFVLVLCFRTYSSLHRNGQSSMAVEVDENPDPDSPAGSPPVLTSRHIFAIGSWTANERPLWVNEWADGVSPKTMAEITDEIEPFLKRGYVVAIRGQPNVLVIQQRVWDHFSHAPEFQTFAAAVGSLLYYKGFGGRLEIRAAGEFDQPGLLLATYSLRTGLKPIRP